MHAADLVVRLRAAVERAHTVGEVLDAAFAEGRVPLAFDGGTVGDDRIDIVAARSDEGVRLTISRFTGLHDARGDFFLAEAFCVLSIPASAAADSLADLSLRAEAGTDAAGLSKLAKEVRVRTRGVRDLTATGVRVDGTVPARAESTRVLRVVEQSGHVDAGLLADRFDRLSGRRARMRGNLAVTGYAAACSAPLDTNGQDVLADEADVVFNPPVAGVIAEAELALLRRITVLDRSGAAVVHEVGLTLDFPARAPLDRNEAWVRFRAPAGASPHGHLTPDPHGGFGTTIRCASVADLLAAVRRSHLALLLAMTGRPQGRL